MTGMLSTKTARDASSARTAARILTATGGTTATGWVCSGTVGFRTERDALTADAIPLEKDRTAIRPAFLAMETTWNPTVFRSGERERCILLEDFFLDPRRNDLVIIIK